MAVFTTIFGNREVALLIWLMVLVTVGLVSKSLRPSFVGTFRAFFAPKLIAILGLTAAYTGLLVYVLSTARIWTEDLAGETTFWFLGPVLVMFFQLNEASEHPHFFRRAFMSVFSLTVVIEFVINVYPLDLVAELILVPVFVLLGGMVAVAGARDEYKQVRGALNFILGAIGAFFVGYALYRIGEDPREFATVGTVREFMVPLLLTVGMLPFIYVVALFFTYEMMFLRLRWKLGDGPLYRYAKRQALRTALFRLQTVRRFATAYPAALVDSSNRSDVDRATRKLKRTRDR